MSQVPDYVLEARARVPLFLWIIAIALNGIFIWCAVWACIKLLEDLTQAGIYGSVVVIMVGLLAYFGEVLFWYIFGGEVFSVQGNKLTVYYRNCYSSEKVILQLNQMWRIRIQKRTKLSRPVNVILQLGAVILTFFNLEAIGYADLRGRNEAIISFVYKAREREFGTEISEAQARELFRYLLEKGYLQSNQFQKSRSLFRQ